MLHSKGRVVGALSLALMGLMPAGVARASTLFYTNEADFDAAAGNVQSFGFSGIVGQYNATSYGTASGFTRDGVDFVGTTGNGGYYLGVEGPDFITSDYNHGLNEASLQGPAATDFYYGIPNGTLTIKVPTGTTAFGLNLFSVLAGDYSGSGTDLVTLSTGGTSGSTITPPYTGAAFIGVVSTTPITTLTLTGTGAEEFPTIVGVSFGSSSSTMSPVPLPASAPMFGAALMAFGAIGYGLKRKKAAGA